MSTIQIDLNWFSWSDIYIILMKILNQIIMIK